MMSFAIWSPLSSHCVQRESHANVCWHRDLFFVSSECQRFEHQQEIIVICCCTGWYTRHLTTLNSFYDTWWTRCFSFIFWRNVFSWFGSWHRDRSWLFVCLVARKKNSIWACLVSCLSDDLIPWIDRMFLMLVVDKIPTYPTTMLDESQTNPDRYVCEKPDIAKIIAEKNDPFKWDLSVAGVDSENISIVADALKNSTVWIQFVDWVLISF